MYYQNHDRYGDNQKTTNELENSPQGSAPKLVFDPNDANSFAVRIDTDSDGNLRQASRGLERTLGQDIDTLPSKTDTASALQVTPYDASPGTSAQPDFAISWKAGCPMVQAFTTGFTSGWAGT